MLNDRVRATALEVFSLQEQRRPCAALRAATDARLRALADRRQVRYELLRKFGDVGARFGAVFRAWAVMSRLAPAERALRTIRAQMAARQRNAYMEELTEAWEARDLATAWRVLKLLGGRRQRRLRTEAVGAALSLGDFLVGACREGAAGGFRATVVAAHPLVEVAPPLPRPPCGRRPSRLRGAAPAFVPAADDGAAAPSRLGVAAPLPPLAERRAAASAALADMVATTTAAVPSRCSSLFGRSAPRFLHDIAREVWRSRLRRGVPPWSAPAEVWRMICWPWAATCTSPPVLGGDPLDNDFAFLKGVVQDFLSLIWSTGDSPLHWHCSQAFSVTKKHSAAELQYDKQRTVHCVDPLGASVASVCWRRAAVRPPLPFEHGYVAHRRREDPVAQHLCLAWRLRRCKLSYLQESFDSKNAFLSPEHDSLCGMLDEHVADPLARKFLCERIRGATTRVRTREGAAVFALGSGVPPGDRCMPDVFRAFTQPSFQQWAQQLRDEGETALVAASVVSRRPLDLSTSAYADDLFRTTLLKKPAAAEVQRVAERHDTSLGAHLRPYGVA